MASVTKSISGAVTTYVITDVAGNTLTIASTAGAVTGNTTTLTTSAGVHDDALQLAFNLLNQLQTGLQPGSGAQELIP